MSMMSLRPGAVNFEEKWRGLKETLGAVVQLQRVRMITWNDHYSYPPTMHTPCMFNMCKCSMSHV